MQRWTMVLVVCNVVTAVGVIASVYNPSVLARDARITQLQDDLRSARDQIDQLKSHQRAMVRYQNELDDYHRQKQAESDARDAAAAWRTDVSTRLDQIQEACRAR